MEIEYNLVNIVQTLKKSDVPGNGAKNLLASRKLVRMIIMNIILSFNRKRTIVQL